MFSSCTSLTDIVLPESLNYISGYAFSGCESLTKIDIPENVTSIEGFAFSGCTSLHTIVLHSDAPEIDPEIIDYVFSECPIDMQIFVPEDAVGYDLRPWSDYEIIYQKNYLKGDPTGDGKVQIADLRMVLRAVCSKTELSSQQQLAADVETDGIVNIADLRKILRFVCGKLEEL